jgi:alpha-beta hydrolase superfamily lysophospholipase
MHVIIVHGMGRTPLSQCLLTYRLRSAGFSTSLFAYSVTFESWAGCVNRLRLFFEKKGGEQGFIVVTHSLGSGLTRAVLPEMVNKPAACFFLAPPLQKPVMPRVVFLPVFGIVCWLGRWGNILLIMNLCPLCQYPVCRQKSMRAMLG